MNDLDTIIINEDEAGLRLDKILAQRYQNVKSRSYFQYLFEEQKIIVNGIPQKKKYLPNAGEEVHIHFILTPELGLNPEAIPLDIIFEDEDIIVINKPAGMVVHPAHGNWTGTFVNALLYHCQMLFDESKKAEGTSDLRPGIVHRLDKDTSGLLIAAKNMTAQQRLIDMFAKRSVYKEYLAICLGNPGEREIHAPIGRHPVHRQMMTVREEGGREAISVCKTLATQDKLSLVKVVILTGRTHQIRVHMKHAGTPILGDEIYGASAANKKYNVSRQLLHAYRLRFSHPMTGASLQFQAPIPEDMLHFTRILKYESL